MKKCRNCGADLPEGASFCPHCAQSQIEKQEVKPPRLWRKKALIAALCVLVLVTAALAVFLAVARAFGCLTRTGTALSEHLVLRVKNGVNAKQRGSKPLYCLICK